MAPTKDRKNMFSPDIEQRLQDALEGKTRGMRSRTGKAINPADPKMIKVLTDLSDRKDLHDYLEARGEEITIYNGSTNATSIALRGEGLVGYELEGSGRPFRITERKIPEYAVLLQRARYTPEGIIQTVEKGLEKLLP
jgi:hypothetical protein